jgi:hypothetical protein
MIKPQMIEIHIELQRMSRLMNDASTYNILNMFHMMWKKRWLICVTIARNWLLHWAHKQNSWYSTLKSENLQVCENCHTSLKFISRILRRAILVGDVNYFHQRMMFVLSWIIGDATSLFYQSLNFVCTMSYSIMTPPELGTVIRSGTTAKADIKPPVLLISCLSHLYHLGLVPVSS